MPTYDSNAVRMLGAEAAMLLGRLVEVWQAGAQRGARFERYSDRLAADDTGLSVDQVRRARRTLQQIGIVVCAVRGVPPVVEYDLAACLERVRAWYAANGLQFGASARSIRRQRQINSALALQRCGASATTDQRDQDDQEREIAALALKNGWAEEEWRREAQVIKARCAQRGGVRDLEAYTYASLLTAAQAGPRARVQPQQDPRRRVWRRPVVTYTEAEREAARERARQRLAEILLQEEPNENGNT